MKRIFFVALSAIAIFSASAVLAYTSPGSPQGYVTDFAGIISEPVEKELEAKLSALEKSDSTQIAVVTVSSLEEDVIENYAVELFSEWGIGKKDIDNGVLLLVAPHERKVRIEVGYGLEGALTDLESHQIINTIMLPAFKNGEYDRGIQEGVFGIVESVHGEYVAPATPKKRSFSLESIGWVIWLVLFGIFELFASMIRAVSKSHAIWPGGLVGGVFAGIAGLIIVGLGAIFGVFVIGGVLFGLFIDYVLSRHPKVNQWGSRFGRDSTGRSWFIGGGRGGRGGGFGGFGGGMSGGGGASGSW